MFILTVRWLLAGCCGLALINLTAAANQKLQISQKPRFYGVVTNKQVVIYCMSPKQHVSSTVQWHKATTFNSATVPVHIGDRISVRDMNLTKNAFLILTKLTIEDQGVYFCEIAEVQGPGTEVQVARPVNLSNLLYRSQMKDGLMILQGLLLATCIAAFVFRKQKLLDRKDSIYEEPEVDHIYEGLAIETCEGDLYEEISVYAQPEGAEAPWE